MASESQDLDQLLRYLKGEMSETDVQDLEHRLMKDGELRKDLLTLSLEESVLTDWAQTERIAIGLDDEVFQDEALPTKASEMLILFPRIGRFTGWWAAAVVLVASLSLLLWYGHYREDATLPGVAYLVAAVNAEWKGDLPELHTSMAAGHYRLQSGSIDLLFTDGARVSVSGPASFNLKGARHIHLDSGNLVAQIPEEALGFIVTSPQSEVVDLGTEFGVSVSEGGETDVHVLDGLVEVLPRIPNGNTKGVMIPEGQARRFNGKPGTPSTEIPVSSRDHLIGNQRFNELGLRMLRGSVRVVKEISKGDLVGNRTGRNWIDLVAEQGTVTLEQPLEVTINAPGSYREFGFTGRSLSSGITVNSYLLHFRPSSFKQVHGVIRFGQPIVGVICNGTHLQNTDPKFGISSVHYPETPGPRGMEPGPYA
ncbi:MAG: FecR family protein, partial [Verrucomicrobiota bacterium]